MNPLRARLALSVLLLGMAGGCTPKEEAPPPTPPSAYGSTGAGAANPSVPPNANQPAPAPPMGTPQ